MQDIFWVSQNYIEIKENPPVRKNEQEEKYRPETNNNFMQL